MKVKKTPKELNIAIKDFKAVCKLIESVRTEIVKTHDYLVERYWSKLTTQDAYNLGLIGNLFINKQFPNDFGAEEVQQSFMFVTEMKERLEKELD